MSVETIILEGHISSEQLIAALAPVANRLRMSGRKVALLIDVAGMTSYEVQAVVTFLVWHERHRSAIHKLAIVLDPNDVAVREVAAAIGLTARAKLRAWDRYDQALEWASLADSSRHLILS